MEQGGFSRAGTAHDSEEVFFLDIKINSLQNLETTGTVVVLMADITGGDEHYIAGKLSVHCGDEVSVAVFQLKSMLIPILLVCRAYYDL